MRIMGISTTHRRKKFTAFSLLAFALVLIFSTRLRRHQREALPVERICHDGTTRLYPKPLVIFVAGGARTGTTYVYNLVRILLRQRDPNLISGWYEDLSYAAARYASPDPPASPVLDDATAANDHNSWRGALDAYKTTGTTVLVKVHSLVHATRLFSGCDGADDGEIRAKSCPVDAVVLSHRDLGPQVSSLKRMGWGRAITKTELSDPAEFCRRRKDPISRRTPRLSDREWSSERTWVSQATALVQCHDEWHKSAGPKIAVDAQMEETVAVGVSERVQLAKDIIKAVKKFDNSPEGNWANSVMDAEMAVQEADALRPLSCSSWQAVNPISHMHRGHVSSNVTDPKDEEVRERGFAAIDADPGLKKWRKARGYA